MCPTTLGDGVRDKIAEQQHKNTARHIIGSLQTWDLKPDLAARRWVWELLQNAVDTAVVNRKQLTLTFTLAADSLVFEHNGGPFRDQDLAALILAGSAKPFDNSPYVGRFGTGFLVTHAISKYVLVSGKADGYPGGFAIELDRRGSEDEIRTQIDRCYDQLDQEQPTTELFARFEYKNVPPAGFAVASKGLQLLDDLLPYIFAFNEFLDTVVLRSEDLSATWQRGMLKDEPALHELLLRRQSPSGETNYAVYIGRPADRSLAAAAVKLGPDPELMLLGPDVPKVYRNFPLIDSECAGLPIAIHAPFDVDEQRSALFLAADSEPVAQADEAKAKRENHALALQTIGGLPQILCTIAQMDVPHAELVAAVERSTGPLAYADAWNKVLRDLAIALLTLPLVRANSSPQRHIDVHSGVFLQPTMGSLRLNASMFWTLASEFSVPLPTEDTVEAWERILGGWELLGVKTANMWNVHSLLERARKHANLASLGGAIGANEEGAINWILRLFKLLTPLSASIPPKFLSGLLPNQESALAVVADPAIDDGVDDDLKDIAEALGLSLRAKLLDCRVVTAETRPLLGAQVPAHINTPEATKLVTAYTRTQILEKNRLIGNGRWNPDDPLLLASGRLFAWFVAQRPAYDDLARDLPLLNAEGKLLAQSNELRCLLPIEAWAEDAKAFVDVFPESKRLSSLYWKAVGDSGNELRAALLSWGICFQDVIYVENEVRLKGKLIQKLAVQPSLPVVAAEADYTCPLCSRIPIIGEVIGRISSDRGRAGRFLTFLLDYVIHRDTQWRVQASAKPVSERSEVVAIRPSEWLGQVLKDAWVPDPNAEDGSTARVVATPESLYNLVPWQTVNADQLKSDFLQLFGFDHLDVWIQSNCDGNKDLEARLRSGLANVAQIAGSTGLEDLFRVLEEKRANQDKIRTNKQFGLHVQDLVRQLLKAKNKEVDVIDRGYDFKVYERGDADADTDLGKFSAGRYLVEVKAARADEVRMSSLQGETAAGYASGYVLCVVDLRNTATLRPSIQEVAAAIRITSDIGVKLQSLFKSVTGAVEGVQGIRVEEARQLRYCVGESIWASGITLDEWITAAF